MPKTKNKESKALCSAEKVINAANWDKYSPWTSLVNKVGLEPWKAPKVAENQKQKT